jgi:hypothetical protein
LKQPEVPSQQPRYTFLSSGVDFPPPASPRRFDGFRRRPHRSHAIGQAPQITPQSYASHTCLMQEWGEFVSYQ